MDVIEIIERYYKKDSDLYNTLVNHSKDVTKKAVIVAHQHPELNIDIDFIKEAGMLHDIGMFLTYAPEIHCVGIVPYICHGYLGREILESLGYPRHALVCERHTGTGISLEQIIVNKLPLPKRDLIPESIEEQVICFADCFFSKSQLGKELSINEIKKKLAKHGEESVLQFERWCELFL